MKKRIRKAVIPAGGCGTRFLPVTKVIPKELLPIGHKPALQFVIEEAQAAGIEEIILVCHPSKTALVDYFRPAPALRKDLKRKGMQRELNEILKVESFPQLTVVWQYEPLGLGHAIGCAREAVGDEMFLVLLPDMIVDSSVPAASQLVCGCKEGEWGLLLEQVEAAKISNYGVICGEETAAGVYQVRGAIEKPRWEEAPSCLGIMGRYLFPAAIFECIAQSGRGSLGEIQLSDAINALAQRWPAKGLICQGYIFDVGTPEGLLRAATYFERQWQNDDARPSLLNLGR